MKTVKPEPTETKAGEDSLISLFAEQVQQGTESFFAAQRILLDLVVRQNSMAMHALRERLAAAKPGSSVAVVAGEGLAGFIAAQKILLNLALRQNGIVMKGLKERVGVSLPAAAMADLLGRSVETYLHLQQHFLDVASTQTQAWTDAAKTGKAFAGKKLPEVAREGLEHVAETQKDFLDMIAGEIAKATNSTRKSNGAGKAAVKTELAELARESADAFIDAQKKLLDEARHRLDVSAKTVRETVNAFTPVPGTSLAELTRQGVESFVAAQKALLEVMVKPRRGATGARAKTHSAHPPARKARAHA